jgi:RHH-type rel operon transcriptional repressor/antitoxin RelB
MSSQPAKPTTTNECQIREIQAAIKEADAGDFATDAEVKAAMDKWNVHAN